MLPDMSDTDLELLSRYTRQHAEDAFAELVRRHLGLVYSAALRQVRSPQLAEEVAQSVFLDLARSAPKLKPGTILTAWLYQVTRRTAIDVVRREASRQLRESRWGGTTEINAMNATSTDWTHIGPLLDEAMHVLDETDRTAVLLRYFENKSLREVGAMLGMSENAAQKRLARAVERLRDFFAGRGITIDANGLVVLISANAVIVAPIGLSAATASAVAAGGMALGFGAQIAALTGRLGLPAVGVSILVMGTVALVALRAVRSPGTSQPAVSAQTGSAPSGSAITSPGQNTARARPGRETVTPAIAVSADTGQRDWALKLYRDGEALQRQKQFDEALAKYNMAAAIIESGLPPERWMVDFYFTRATMRPDAPTSLKRDYAAEIDDYTKALRIHPNFSSALANRAMAHSALKQFESANADFTRLIEDPAVDYSTYLPGRTNGVAWAYEYRGRMWLDERRPGEAIPDLQNAVALYDKPYEKVHAQFYLAAAYKSSQQRERLVAEADSMAGQALQWATRPSGTDEEKSAATSAMRWANEFLDYKASYQLEVAAAVEAKLGNFAEAAKYQERALRELSPSGESQREAMQARLEIYRARRSLVSP